MKNYIINDPFPTWYYIPCMIKWKVIERNKIDKNKNYLINTINASILLDITSYIEGVITEMVQEIIWVRDFKDKKNMKYLENLTRYIDDKILKSSWRESILLLEMISGKKSSSLIDGEVLKSISTLFSFRNLITHGIEIDIFYYEDKGKISAQSVDKYESILKYLIEKKLVNTSFEPNINTINILDDTVIAYFIDSTFKYVEELFNLVKDFELDGLKNNFHESLELT